MNDFQRSNKLTGVYWLKKPIEKLTIKIELKYDNSISNLPQIEQFHTGTALNQLEEQRTEEHSFKWQQKVFSAWEKNRYTDRQKCITDTELYYHDLITKDDVEPRKLFTYIQEDKFSSPSLLEDESLTTCFERLDINEKIGRMNDAGSRGHLFRSEEVLDKEHWLSMHIVLDGSDYNEDSQLLLKRESLLLSLHYNAMQRCLFVTPDANNMEWNPYSVEGVKGCVYGVELSFVGLEGSEELVTLLNRLKKRWRKKNRAHIQFNMPPLGKRQCLVKLDIQTAYGFEMDDLYIEYHIKLDEGVHCEDVLQGRTHMSKALRTDDDALQWLFGHAVELSLVFDVGFDPPPIKIYFEVISNDWWNIQRTEGYAHMKLRLQPGQITKTLDCIRPEEKDRLEAQERRFFVGGCNMIQELDVLGTPQVQNLNYRLVSTGTITLSTSVISQVQIAGAMPIARSTPGSSSDLLLGAEAVLKQYMEARARLAAATKDLDGALRVDEE